MPTTFNANMRSNGEIGGVTISGVTRRTDPGQRSVRVSIAGAKTGTLTTRSTNVAGTLTMEDANHGIETGDHIAIYWEVGGVPGRQYDATVGTVSGTSVPFTLGVGDNLPAQGSAVTAMVPQVIDFDFDTDNVTVFAMVLAARGFVTICETGPTGLLVADLSSGESQLGMRETADGGTPIHDFPFAGDAAAKTIVQLQVSQAGTTAAEFSMAVQLTV